MFKHLTGLLLSFQDLFFMLCDHVINFSLWHKVSYLVIHTESWGRKWLSSTENKICFHRGKELLWGELLCVCMHICIELSPSQDAVSLAPPKQNFILCNILIVFWNVEEHIHQRLSLAHSYFHRKEILQIIQETYNN